MASADVILCVLRSPRCSTGVCSTRILVRCSTGILVRCSTGILIPCSTGVLVRCSATALVEHQVAVGLENETVAVPRARAPQLDRNAAREIVDGQVAIL